MLPPHVDDVGASSSPVCVPHTCITCKNICPGPIGDLSKYQFGFEEDKMNAHTKATNPDVREEGYAKPWNPSVLVRVYIFLL